jgi:cell filamentation protein
MQSKPPAASALTAELRQQLEAEYTFRRVVELELDPMRGNFDAAHLKEINRRIFQDLPAAGFTDVTPGEFRQPVAAGFDWMKQRGLSTVAGAFHVAYSRMDDAAIARIDKALEGAKPDQLRGLNTAEFTIRLAQIYTELDYAHPFSDGNSRTLRSFTKQLAEESGFALDWTRFNRSDVGRDLLCIARDLSVNALAKPQAQHEDTIRNIQHTQDRLESNRALPELLPDVVRPLRAMAFEELPEAEAVKAHPELASAYAVLAQASRQMAADGLNTEQRDAAISRVRENVAKALEAGQVPGQPEEQRGPER